MTATRQHLSPTRSCVGCGRRDAQGAMVRLRLDEAGNVVESGSKRTGRGAYVHPAPDCVRGLAKSRGLGRSLRTNVAGEARRAILQALEGRLFPGAPESLRKGPDAPGGAGRR